MATEETECSKSENCLIHLNKADVFIWHGRTKKGYAKQSSAGNPLPKEEIKEIQPAE